MIALTQLQAIVQLSKGCTHLQRAAVVQPLAFSMSTSCFCKDTCQGSNPMAELHSLLALVRTLPDWGQALLICRRLPLGKF